MPIVPDGRPIGVRRFDDEDMRGRARIGALAGAWRHVIDAYRASAGQDLPGLGRDPVMVRMAANVDDQCDRVATVDRAPRRGSRGP